MGAVFGVFTSPASAAPPGLPDIGAFCFVSGGPCTQVFSPPVGTGQNLTVSIGNKCDGPSVCDQTFIFIGGKFGTVVVTMANECTNGATCRILVDGHHASFKSLMVRGGVVFDPFDLGGTKIQNRCDASSVCVKTASGPNTPDGGGTCTDDVPGTTCLIGFGDPDVGYGGDLYMPLGNKCAGPVTCALDFTLAGSYNRVVMDRANDCSNHATCSITVHNEAQINSLQIRDRAFRLGSTVFRDLCDATAVCTKTP